MLGVLLINVALASWEGAWTRRLRSDILGADARHTFADVLTTIVVIFGWQLSARGYPWLDTVCAIAVAMLVLALALGFFGERCQSWWIASSSSRNSLRKSRARSREFEMPRAFAPGRQVTRVLSTWLLSSIQT